MTITAVIFITYKIIYGSGEDYYKGLRMKSNIDSNSKNQGKESKSSLNKTMAEHYSDSHLSGGHLSYLDKTL